MIYWQDKESKIEKFTIDDGKRHHFAVILPGGGYSGLATDHEGVQFAKKINERGHSAFVVHYGTGENASFPKPIEDVARAIKHILDNAEKLNLYTDTYSIWGSSAGGHLASISCTEKVGLKSYGIKNPKTAVLVYPVITMTDLTHGGSRRNLLGENPNEELINKTSVEKNITSDYPATFVWCGDADDAVPPENTKMMHSALTNANVPNEMHIYKDVNHGVGLGDGLDCEGWITLAIDFWENQIKE